jgi:RimJ/RimL family protein N-acetyltransferase
VSEALALVSEHAFVTVNLLRLFALPFADNVASIRVLEKAGYVREAILRSSSVKFGHPRDQALYARINPTWRGVSD